MDFVESSSLELTPRERVAVSLLMDSLCASLQRRLPRGLRVHFVRVELVRESPRRDAKETR
jgi:hypothetical protein